MSAAEEDMVSAARRIAAGPSSREPDAVAEYVRASGADGRAVEALVRQARLRRAGEVDRAAFADWRVRLAVVAPLALAAPVLLLSGRYRMAAVGLASLSTLAQSVVRMRAQRRLQAGR